MTFHGSDSWATVASYVWHIWQWEQSRSPAADRLMESAYRGVGGGLLCHLPGIIWDSGETTKTLLDSPKAGTFFTSSLPASFGDRTPGKLFVESFYLALLDGGRMSLENLCRDVGPESLNTFWCSSVSNWVWPLRIWVLLQLCSILHGRGLSTLVTKLYWQWFMGWFPSVVK